MNRASSFLPFITVLLLAVPLCSRLGAQDPAPGKPNIIYINVDDLGWADLGFQGSGYYETPNIDRLAKAGAVFTNAYAPASNCAPSRASCLTGQWPPRHGVYTVASSERGKAADRKLIPTKNTLHIKPDNLTIAGALQQSGYTTCHIGKWHISRDPTANGFDLNIAGNHLGSPDWGGYHSPYAYPNCKQEKPGEYLTDRLTDEAIGFIGRQKDGPFFLHLAYYTVHVPLEATKEKLAHFRKKKGTKAHRDPTYAAMISSLDDNIGKLMKCLEDSGLMNNTLILFTSDNGGYWRVSKQWPLRAGKGSYYEGGIREPLILVWKGAIKASTRIDTPVCGIDYFPTFLAAADLPKPKDKLLDGENILPLAMGEERESDRALYWHFPIYLQAGNPECQDPVFRTRPGSAIRLGDWKLIEYFENGDRELYNLAQDPGEKRNLIKSSPAPAAKLQAMLDAWRRETKAPVPMKENPAYQAP